MIVIFIVLPLALLLAGAALWGFMSAAKQGQFDDLDTPPIRILFDSEEAAPGAGGTR